MEVLVVKGLNKLIAAIGAGISAILSLLPNSPFNSVLNIDNKYLQYINYIFPVAGIVAHLVTYLTAVAAYYIIRLIMRWIKLAGN